MHKYCSEHQQVKSRDENSKENYRPMFNKDVKIWEYFRRFKSRNISNTE